MAVAAALLRVTRVISPSLLTITTSSELLLLLVLRLLILDRAVFRLAPVLTESANCRGVNEPVLDRVTMRRPLSVVVVPEEAKHKDYSSNYSSSDIQEYMLCCQALGNRSY